MIHTAEFRQFLDTFPTDIWKGIELETEEATRQFDRIFRIVEPIHSDDIDEYKSFWLRTERESADEAWDYEEMLACGDVKDRKDFESLFLSMYPYEEDWLTIGTKRLCCKDDFRAIFLDHSHIIQIDRRERPVEGVRCPWQEDSIAIWLGRIADELERLVTMIVNGTYGDWLKGNLPLRMRYGAVPSEVIYRRFPDIRERIWNGLTEEEVEEFRVAIETGHADDEPLDRLERMDAYTYQSVFAHCVRAFDKRFDKDMSDSEIYRSVTFGYTNEMLEIDPHSEEEFNAWQNSYMDHHNYELKPGHTPFMVHLYPIHDEKGWYYEVAGTQSTMETVRAYLKIHSLGLPVTVMGGKMILSALLGKDRIRIIPRDDWAYGSYWLGDEEMLWGLSFDEELEKDRDIMAAIEWDELDIPTVKK